MKNRYDLINAIKQTSGTQQSVWKDELQRLVMRDIYCYVDTACAHPFSSEELVSQEQDVQAALQLLLSAIPTTEEAS